MTRTFEPLNDAEHDWLNLQLENATRVVQAFAPENASSPLKPSALDLAFSRFLTSEQSALGGSIDIVTAIGVAFGKNLVDRLGFAWVIATDDYGTGLAVLGRPGRGDVTVFPIEFVAKRHERQESDFIEHSIDSVEEDLERIAADWGDNDRP